MTFLQLINKVLVGLREDTVLGINGVLPNLVAQFVNEAKEEIEDIGPWFALRTTLTGSTVAGTETISFTSTTNERSYILHDGGGPCVWITTADEELRLGWLTIEQMNDRYNSDASQDQDKPCYFSYTVSNDGITMRFWPLPDAVYTVKATAVVPQDELTATTDVLTIAAAPVWKLALAKAMDERGSEFAGNTQANFAKAKGALDDYMLRDFGSEPYTFQAI